MRLSAAYYIVESEQRAERRKVERASWTLIGLAVIAAAMLAVL
jgi:hypothetical protein